MQEANKGSSSSAPGGRSRDGAHFAKIGTKLVKAVTSTPENNTTVRKKRRRAV
jgi:hypothetical protein